MQTPDSHEIEDLTGELHKAGDHFHESREQLEKVMDGSDYRHQERVNMAQEKVREAEREVEGVEARIKKALKPEENRP